MCVCIVAVYLLYGVKHQLLSRHSTCFSHVFREPTMPVSEEHSLCWYPTPSVSFACYMLHAVYPYCFHAKMPLVYR